MYKKVFLLLVIANAVCAMQAPQSPIPPNRFFLSDLMEAYATRKPLHLESKSKATLVDILNWINYARNNQAVRAEFARELQGTEQDVDNALDILQFEIEQVQAAPVQTQQTPAKQPVVLKPTAKPTPAKPVVLKPIAKPAAAKPAGSPSPVDYLLSLLTRNNAIQRREGNFVQVKTIDQFKLGGDTGPATCPVQALRNTIKVLQFVRTGLQGVLGIINDAQDAREFLNIVEKCGQGTQWLTAEELKIIINKAGENIGNLAQSIIAKDTIQELLIDPAKLKELQDLFKQRNASYGFILGTMDVGQFTGERGHYFSFVIHKAGPDYLYLIADTAPKSDHLDADSYNYKRVHYLADLITKGKSDIDLNKELNKIAGNRYQDQLVRALQRGAQFDFKSLSRNEAEGLENAVQEAERNKAEWKNRTRLDDAQLANALNIVRKNVRERLNQRR